MGVILLLAVVGMIWPRGAFVAMFWLVLAVYAFGLHVQ